MKVYIKVSRDKFELIEGIADTPQELAWLCRAKWGAVYKGLERFKKGQKSIWQEVNLNEDKELQRWING